MPGSVSAIITDVYGGSSAAEHCLAEADIASIDDLRPDDEMITDLKGISTNDFEEVLVA